MWDPAIGEHLRALTDGDVSRRVIFSRDGRLPAATNVDGARVWNPATGEHVRTLAGRNYELVVYGALSSDGRLLATGSVQAARVWDLAAGEHLRTLIDHLEVEDVAFSPDGRLLATGSWDHTARLWD